jgi:hypothetical protein
MVITIIRYSNYQKSKMQNVKGGANFGMVILLHSAFYISLGYF